MSWRPYSNKRAHNLTVCGECEEEYIDTSKWSSGDDNWDVCGDCQKVMCAYCSQNACDVCKENGGAKTAGVACCETCTASCDDCGYDVLFHECCKADHLENCNAKSRAERAAAAAAQRVSETESQLYQEKERLKRLQSSISDLEQQLKHAKEEKAKADIALEKEKNDSATKQEK